MSDNQHTPVKPDEPWIEELYAEDQTLPPKQLDELIRTAARAKKPKRGLVAWNKWTGSLATAAIFIVSVGLFLGQSINLPSTFDDTGAALPQDQKPESFTATSKIETRERAVQNRKSAATMQSPVPATPTHAPSLEHLTRNKASGTATIDLSTFDLNIDGKSSKMANEKASSSAPLSIQLSVLVYDPGCAKPFTLPDGHRQVKRNNGPTTYTVDQTKYQVNCDANRWVVKDISVISSSP